MNTIIHVAWISILLLVLISTARTENTNLSSVSIKKINDEELIQLFSHPKWGDKALSEITERIRENDSDQNKELGKLFFRYWKESDDSNKIKEKCLQGLRLVKSQEAVGFFTNQLFEGKTRTDRVLAAHYLGTIRSASAVSALESAVSADKGVFGPGRSIARESIFALGKMGNASVPALTKIWCDEALRRDCEEAIVSAMGHTKDKSFTPILIEILDGNNEMVRDNAAWALGEIGDDTSIPVLRKHQQDSNANVRENVLQAITKIERHKIIGDVSQPTTNQTAVEIRQIHGSGKTNDLGTTRNATKP